MKHKILIVDDEKALTESLKEGLSAMEEDWEILIASNGREAIKILGDTPIDLLITDLRMPEMDGFQLITYVSNFYPELPVIVMSAHATEKTLKELEKMNIDMFIGKNFTLETLHHKINSVLDGVAFGFVKGINVISFLQLIELEQKTCTLKISTNEKSASLYFKKGTLLDVELNGKSGEEVLLEIIPWKNPIIEIKNRCPKTEKKIKYDLKHLILEALRIQDEKEKNEN